MICPTCDGKGHVDGCYMQDCKGWPVSRCWHKTRHEWISLCKACEEHFRFWGRIGLPEAII